MTFNEGTWDRVIRMLVGLGLGYAAWMTWPGTATILGRTGIVSLGYLVVGVEVFVTGVIGWSPMYALFSFSTKEKVGA
jgi:Inner membrane protein YgaP-like, transmembrane domain